ncbi:Uncharacterised protein [Vibrio cholerae]|uniref:Uncharacterized protein n=1 Tax=Vibrio cholerae TaxID=666 RepID=A0A655WME8_VIBCL|nr:Uncharacterised protein [Vibrio cholerae]
MYGGFALTHHAINMALLCPKPLLHGVRGREDHLFAHLLLKLIKSIRMVLCEGDQLIKGW